jgi:hypothetical protein
MSSYFVASKRRLLCILDVGWPVLTVHQPACTTPVHLNAGGARNMLRGSLLPPLLPLLQRRQFRTAAKTGDVAEIQKGLDAGVDVNCKDRQVGISRTSS